MVPSGFSEEPIEVEVVVNNWRKEYNAERPHSSIKYKTPDEFFMELCIK